MSRFSDFNYSFSSVIQNSRAKMFCFNLLQFVSALFQSRRKSLSSYIRMEKNLLLARKRASKIHHFQDNNF